MDAKHISITDVIERLKEFPEEALDWNTPTDMQRIQDFEREFNIELPHEFVTLLKETNGFSLEGFEIIGFSTPNYKYGLEETYRDEHFEMGKTDACTPGTVLFRWLRKSLLLRCEEPSHCILGARCGLYAASPRRDLQIIGRVYPE